MRDQQTVAGRRERGGESVVPAQLFNDRRRITREFELALIERLCHQIAAAHEQQKSRLIATRLAIGLGYECLVLRPECAAINWDSAGAQSTAHEKREMLAVGKEAGPAMRVFIFAGIQRCHLLYCSA